MGFTLFGEKYKYEVDSINIGFFCPDGTLSMVLELKDGTYKSIDVNLGVEKYKLFCKENNITGSVPVLMTQEYIDKLDKEMKHKYKWGEWKEVYTYFMDPFSRREKLLVYNVRTNGKRVQAEFDGVKTMASCNIEAGDQFDYKFGRELAERRLIAKLIEKRANSYCVSKISKTN